MKDWVAPECKKKFDHLDRSLFLIENFQQLSLLRCILFFLMHLIHTASQSPHMNCGMDYFLSFFILRLALQECNECFVIIPIIRNSIFLFSFVLTHAHFANPYLVGCQLCSDVASFSTLQDIRVFKKHTLLTNVSRCGSFVSFAITHTPSLGLLSSVAEDMVDKTCDVSCTKSMCMSIWNSFHSEMSPVSKYWVFSGNVFIILPH